MKKYILKLIMLTILLTAFVSTVKAESYDETKFNPGDIVIGSHLFTPEENEKTGYTGFIDTKFSMLAAKSIVSENVSDMNLYIYLGKDQSGNNMWLDFLTEELVTDITFPINITHVNGECIDVTCDGATYKVTFKPGISSTSNTEKIIQVPYSTVLSEEDIPEFVAEPGYKFNGWQLVKDDDENSDTMFDIKSKIKEDTTLLAIWEKINYTITYHTNFSEDKKVTEKNYYYSGKDSAENTKLKSYSQVFADEGVNAGHQFKGWSTSPTGASTLFTEENDLENLLSAGENIELYAIWDSNTYTLSYGENKVSCVYGAECSLADIPKPTEKGKEFKNWYIIETQNDTQKEVDLPEKFYNLTSENKTFTLNPRYSLINYQISYQLDGGYTNDSNPSKITIGDGEVAIPIIPIKTGYTFKGWTIGAEETPLAANKVSLDPTNPQDITLKAKWEANDIAISFKKNDDTFYVDDSGSKITKNCTIENDCILELIPESENKTKKFLGWSYEGLIYSATEKIINNNLFATDNKEIVMTPYWENNNSYKISYQLEKGTFDTSSPITSYFEGTQQIELAKPKKEGYEFTGWEVVNGTAAIATTEGKYILQNLTSGDVELKAKWEAIKYKIDFIDVKSDGSEVSLGQIECTYNISCQFGDHSEAINDSNFIGWGLEKDKLYYGDRLEVMNLTSESNKIINLYSVKNETYKVTFSLDEGTMDTPELTSSKYSPLRLDLSQYTPVKTGHKFIGWQIGDKLISTEDENQTIEVTSNITIIAQYEKNKYSVQLINGEARHTIENIEYNSQFDIASLGDYDISGKWEININDNSKEESNLQEYLSTLTVTDNIIIKKIHTVIISPNVGIANAIEVSDGKKVTGNQIETFVLDGNWIVDTDTTNIIPNLSETLLSTPVTADITYKKVNYVNLIKNGADNKKYFHTGSTLSEFTDEELAGNWIVNDDLNNLQTDLKGYFVGKTITSDYDIVTGFSIIFRVSLDEEYPYYVKYGKHLDVDGITEENVINSEWEKDGVAMTLEDFRSLEITEDYTLTKKLPTPDPTPEPTPEPEPTVPTQ